MLTRLALRLNRFSERWIPSAFVIAALLTFIVLAMAAVLAGKTPAQCVRYWGDGFWALLEFAMQMCLILMTGAMLADSPAVSGALDRCARLPRTPRQAVAFMALASMTLCWLHWGLGMITSAFLARRLVRERPQTDFRLLVTAAYFGMGVVWHAGLSGSAPLLVATPGHFLEAKMGIVPTSETIFSAFNLSLTAAMLLIMTGLAVALYPRERDAVTLTGPQLAALEPRPPWRPGPAPSPWLRLLEQTRAVNVLVGGLGLAWLALDAHARGWGLTLNKVNFIFLMAAILLHPSPASVARSSETAAGYVHGIIVQFPLYAGIYGVIKGAGLDVMIGGWFVRLADARTFPVIVYWYSGILNYFVPSGGSKWAIEAPYLLEAAKTLGVPPAKLVLAYSWGDMVTDLVQPFFCLPLLAVARLEFKDILGYCAIAFAACALIGSAAFLLFA